MSVLAAQLIWTILLRLLLETVLHQQYYNDNVEVVVDDTFDSIIVIIVIGILTLTLALVLILLCVVCTGTTYHVCAHC